MDNFEIVFNNPKWRRFESSVKDRVDEIVMDVSDQDFKECLAQLPTLSAKKVKSKFDDCLKKQFDDDLKNMSNVKCFKDTLSLLADLEMKFTNHQAAWRPTESMDSELLYRPYRIKHLKELIEKREALLHEEQVLVDVQKKILEKFLSTSKRIDSNMKIAKKEINIIEIDVDEKSASLLFDQARKKSD